MGQVLSKSVSGSWRLVQDISQAARAGGRSNAAGHTPLKDFIGGQLDFKHFIKSRFRGLHWRLALAGGVTAGAVGALEAGYAWSGRGEQSFADLEEKFRAYREIVQELREAARRGSQAAGTEAEASSPDAQSDDGLRARFAEDRLASVHGLLQHQDLSSLLGGRLGLLLMAQLGDEAWKDRYLRLLWDGYELLAERSRGGQPGIRPAEQLRILANLHSAVMQFEFRPHIRDWYWQTHFRQLLRMYERTEFTPATHQVWLLLGSYLEDKGPRLQSLLAAEGLLPQQRRVARAKQLLQQRRKQNQQPVPPSPPQQQQGQPRRSAGSEAEEDPEAARLARLLLEADLGHDESEQLDSDGLRSGADIRAVPLSASLYLMPPALLRGAAGDPAGDAEAAEEELVAAAVREFGAEALEPAGEETGARLSTQQLRELRRNNPAGLGLTQLLRLLALAVPDHTQTAGVSSCLEALQPLVDGPGALEHWRREARRAAEGDAAARERCDLLVRVAAGLGEKLERNRRIIELGAYRHHYEMPVAEMPLQNVGMTFGKAERVVQEMFRAVGAEPPAPVTPQAGAAAEPVSVPPEPLPEGAAPPAGEALAGETDPSGAPAPTSAAANAPHAPPLGSAEQPVPRMVAESFAEASARLRRSPEAEAVGGWAGHARALYETLLAPAAAREWVRRHAGDGETTLEENLDTMRWDSYAQMIISGYLVAMLCNVAHVRRRVKHDAAIVRRWAEKVNPKLREYYGLKQESERTHFEFRDSFGNTSDDLLRAQRVEQLRREGLDDEEIEEHLGPDGLDNRPQAVLARRGAGALPQEAIDSALGGPPAARTSPGVGGYGADKLPAPPPPRPRKARVPEREAPADPLESLGAPPEPKPKSSKAKAGSAGAAPSGGPRRSFASFASSAPAAAPGMSRAVPRQPSPAFAAAARRRIQEDPVRGPASPAAQASATPLRLTRFRTPQGRWCWNYSDEPVAGGPPRRWLSSSGRSEESAEASDGAQPATASASAGAAADASDKALAAAAASTVAAAAAKPPTDPALIRQTAELMAKRGGLGLAAAQPKQSAPAMNIHDRKWLELHQPPKTHMLGVKNIARFSSRIGTVGLMAAAGVLALGAGLAHLPKAWSWLNFPEQTEDYLTARHPSEEAGGRSEHERLAVRREAELQLASMFSAELLAQLDIAGRGGDMYERFGQAKRQAEAAEAQQQERQLQQQRHLQHSAARPTHTLYGPERFRRLVDPRMAGLGIMYAVCMTTVLRVLPYSASGFFFFLLTSGVLFRRF